MLSRVLFVVFVLHLAIESQALLEDLDKRVAGCVVANRDVQTLEKEQIFFLGLTVRFVVKKVVNVDTHSFVDEIKVMNGKTFVNGETVVKSKSFSSEAQVREGVYKRIKNETNMFNHGLDAHKIANVAKECFSSAVDKDVKRFNERLQMDHKRSLNGLQKDSESPFDGLRKRFAKSLNEPLKDSGNSSNGLRKD